MDTRHTGALALMAPQHEVVHFIYADQEIVGVKIPINKGGLRGLCFSSQMTELLTTPFIPLF